jgi:two-component system cell cycle sensor histidine kinase/response regulator CckA
VPTGRDHSLLCLLVLSEGLVHSAPAGTRALLGAPGEALAGRPVTELVAPEDHAPLLAAVAEARAGRVLALSCRMLRRGEGGEDLPFAAELAVFPWAAEAGSVALLIREAPGSGEEGLRRLDRELEQAEKIESLGVVAGAIGHEFANYLAVILGDISLARMDVDASPAVRALLDDAERAVTRATGIAKQLQAYSRAGIPSVEDLADLGSLVREATLLALRGSEVRCTHDLPEAHWTTRVDASLIRQVVQNLVTNADQAMPEGGAIEVSVANTAVEEGNGMSLAPGRYVRVSVRDGGKGMPEQVRRRVFDPFFSTIPGKVGLGLTTASAIVRRHGGAMEVASEVGVGSTFSFYLPARADPLLPTASTGRAEAGASRQAQARVLVMDDEPSIRTVAARMLDHMGYLVTAVAHGEAAVEEYRRATEQGRRYDVVLLDLSVDGGMGGKEAMEEIHALDPQARGIVSTGHPDASILFDPHRSGFDAGIAKPYRIGDLSAVLARVLGR